MGYAAGRCPRFRSGAGDAVRFSIGPAATVRWLVVSGGLPERSGEICIADMEGDSAPPGVPGNVLRQMRAYVAAFRASGASR